MTTTAPPLKPDEPGFTLRNGAILLASKPMEEMRLRNDKAVTETVVLAFAPGTYEPFCVWRRTRGIERTATGDERQIDYTFAGDYFRSIDRALAAYKERS